MKTTITALVRDGWLTYSRSTLLPRNVVVAVRVDHINAIADAEPIDQVAPGVELCTESHGNFFLDYAHAASVMDLIHAGSGTITREVES